MGESGAGVSSWWPGQDSVVMSEIVILLSPVPGELHVSGQRLHPLHQHVAAAGAQEGLALPLQHADTPSQPGGQQQHKYYIVATFTDDEALHTGAGCPGVLQGPHGVGGAGQRGPRVWSTRQHLLV